MKSPFLSLNSPILDSLENLGALNGSALYEVKPFKDWKDNKWQNKIFKMRLCNAGEGLEILEELSKVSVDAKPQMMKFQILARAIYTIDGSTPVSVTELEKFNIGNNLQYDQKDYLIFWFGNIEQVVLERLDIVYASLQQKQIRQLSGQHVCDNCGGIFIVLPEGSKKLIYSVSDIICNSCIEKVDKALYDFEEDILNIKIEKLEPTAEETALKTHVCPLCGKDFDDFEEFNQHLTECDSKIPA